MWYRILNNCPFEEYRRKLILWEKDGDNPKFVHIGGSISEELFREWIAKGWAVKTNILTKEG